MEDILNNIHNIDDTHVSDHHLHDVEYHRTDPFNRKAYEAARASYEQRLQDYNNLIWFKRIFTPKPLEPSPADYMYI